jgi:hypothetical protein
MTEQRTIQRYRYGVRIEEMEPNYWRAKAQEIRNCAKLVGTSHLVQRLERLASSYDEHAADLLRSFSARNAPTGGDTGRCPSMPWFVRYGPGLVPPRPADPPRRHRGWKMNAFIDEMEALRIGMEKTREGMSAEAGPLIKGRPRAKIRADVFRELALKSAAGLKADAFHRDYAEKQD